MANITREELQQLVARRRAELQRPEQGGIAFQPGANFDAGIAGVKSSLAGLGEMAAGLYGDPGLTLEARSLRKRLADEAGAASEQANAGRIEDIHSFGDAAAYAGNQILQQGPNMGLTVGAGVLGGLVAGPAGAMAGAGLTGAGLNTGEVYGNLRDLGVSQDDATTTAAVAGPVMGALDMIPAGRVARNVAAPIMRRSAQELATEAAKKAAQRSLPARVGREAAIVAGSEGVTEGLQENVSMGAEAYHGHAPTAADWASRTLNAAAAGAVAGGALGAVSGVPRAPSPAPRAEEALERKAAEVEMEKEVEDQLDMAEGATSAFDTFAADASAGKGKFAGGIKPQEQAQGDAPDIPMLEEQPWTMPGETQPRMGNLRRADDVRYLGGPGAVAEPVAPGVMADPRRATAPEASAPGAQSLDHRALIASTMEAVQNGDGSLTVPRLRILTGENRVPVLRQWMDRLEEMGAVKRQDDAPPVVLSKALPADIQAAMTGGGAPDMSARALPPPPTRPAVGRSVAVFRRNADGSRGVPYGVAEVAGYIEGVRPRVRFRGAAGSMKAPFLDAVHLEEQAPSLSQHDEANPPPVPAVGALRDAADVSREDQDNALPQEAKGEGPRAMASPDDLPFETARRAHMYTSFEPDTRGRQEQARVAEDINGLHEHLSTLALEARQKDVLTKEFGTFKDQYIARYSRVLEARSRVASPMITGPARFPTARNEKADRTYQARLDEFMAWREKAERIIARKIAGAQSEAGAKQETWDSLRKEIDSSLATIGAIDAGESPYERRNFTASIQGQINRLAMKGEVDTVQRALDYVREQQGKLPKPAFTERSSFWSLGEKAAETAKTADRPAAFEQDFDGGRIEENQGDERLRIFFDTKPEQPVIDALKKAGWKWSRANSAWQRKNTTAAQRSALDIVGRFFPGEQPAISYSVTPRDPDDFIPGPDGDVDLGYITEDVEEASGGRYPAKPIRMKEGTKGSVGRAHIAIDKTERIKAAGYPNVESFVADVAKTYSEVFEEPSGRLLLAKERADYHDTAIVELEDKGDYYAVITALPVRQKKNYPQKGGRMLLWRQRPTPLTAPPDSDAPFLTAPDESRQNAPNGAPGQGPLGGTGQNSKIDDARGGQNVKPEVPEMKLAVSTRSQARQVREQVEKLFRQIAGEGPATRWADVIAADPDIARRSGNAEAGKAAGEYDALNNVVTFAVGAGDPLNTAAHEGWRVLRRTRLFTDQERRALATARPAFEKVAREAGLDPEGMDQESLEAVAFARWVTGSRLAGVPGLVRRVFAKMRRFVSGLLPSLVGGRIVTADQVFEAALSGEMKARRALRSGPNGSEKAYSVTGMKAKAGPFMRAPDASDAPGDARADRVRDIGKRIFEQDNKPFRERIRDAREEIFGDIGRRFRQAVVDRFDSLKYYETLDGKSVATAEISPWKAALLTTNLRGVMSHVMRHGPLEVFDTAEGGKWFQPSSKQSAWPGGFEGLFRDINRKTEMDIFKVWMVAKRAKRLMAEERENLLTAQEIRDALDQPAERAARFEKAFANYQSFNKAMLAMAKDAGLLSQDQVDLFTKYGDYVPFYRVMEGEALGPGKKAGLSGQSAGIRGLKGGAAKLADPIENMVKNMAALVDASFKNLAMQKGAALAEQVGVAERIPMKFVPNRMSPEKLASALEDLGVQVRGVTREQRESWTTFFTMTAPTGPDIASVRVDGKARYYRVNDPMLMQSFSSMNVESEAWLKLFSIPKRVLTKMVTSTPDFLIRNMMRDSLSSWITSGQKGFKPWGSATRGLAKSFREDPSLQSMMAAGGAMFQHDDTDPSSVASRLTADQRARVLDAPHKLLKAWEKIGGAFENASRVEMYDAVKKAGGSDTEAAFQALDVMNFGMRGGAAWMRYLTEMVPFLNARVQGLYRLQRGYGADPRLFIMRGAMLAGVSLGLLAMNWDNEDYQALEDWDKDTYWHVFAGGEHFRIPKPFEVGAVFATFAERMAGAVAGGESAEDLGAFAARTALETFAFNPIPQAIRPGLEVMVNHDFFTGRPIVSLGMERLRPEDQASYYTSEPAKWLASSWAGEAMGLSPSKLDHLVKGYFGTIGAGMASLMSWTARSLDPDAPERPDMRFEDLPGIGWMKRDQPARYNKYMTEFYDLHTQTGQIVASLRGAAEAGETERVHSLQERYAPEIAGYKGVNRTAKALSTVNKEIRMLYQHPTMTGAQKRQRLDALYITRNTLAQQAVERSAALRQAIESRQ